MRICSPRLARRLASFIALGLYIAAPAHAGRPLVTEDAGVIEAGQCEIETWAARQRAQGAGKTDGGTFAPACGLDLPWATQIGAAFSGERDPEGRRYAIGLGGKTALKPLTEEEWGFTVAWSLGRAHASGAGWRADDSSLLAVLSVPLQPDLLLHANLGWVRSPGAARRDSAFWAGAIERTGLGEFDLMAEVFGTNGESAWLNAGVRYWLIRERLSLNASAGTKPAGGREALYTLGAKLQF